MDAGDAGVHEAIARECDPVCDGGSNLATISEQIGKSGTQPTLSDNRAACLDFEFFVTTLSMHTDGRLSSRLIIYAYTI